MVKSHILSSKPEGQETHTHVDKRPPKTRTVNRTSTVSQIGGHSATLIENSSNIYFYIFSVLKYKNKTRCRTSNCYLSDLSARDHKHTYKTTCNGWRMDCDLTSFSTVLQLYKDDGRVIMECCVQWNPVYG